MTNRRSLWRRLGWALPAAALAAMTLAVLAVPSAARPADAPIQLVFVYGSEKQKWLDDVTAAFNTANPNIHVIAVPKGSGETVDAVLNDEEIVNPTDKKVILDPKDGKPAPVDLISPASEAYLILGNARAKNEDNKWSQKEGKKAIVPDEHKNLVLSPVVIAMWEPMAKALGWPEKPVSWKALRELAASKDGWASKNHPEWGAFKFSHTQPEKSNSGLLALLEEVYAAAGKNKGLTAADVAAPKTVEFLTDLERAVVHYHTSTGFLSNTMFANGPDYFSAIVTYENTVIDSYPTGDAEKDKTKPKLPFPVVALYPEEGTFISDHPVAIVQRKDLVGDGTDKNKGDEAKVKAAQAYIDFLLKPEQQAKALNYGFRPALDTVKVDKPVDTAHGADPDKPGAGGLLRAPEADVMQAALDLWKQHKKHARVIIAFDQSGSMKWQEGKLENAKEGAKEIIKGLAPEDTVGLLVFNHELHWADKGTKLKDGRDKLLKDVDGIKAWGQTALYDAVGAAYDQLQSANDPDDVSVIVLLTDGVDFVTDDNAKPPKPVGSKISLDDLLKKVKVEGTKNLVLIYTIAYGSEKKEDGGPDPELLKKISDVTKAKSFVSTKDQIKDVMKQILNYF